MYIFMVVIEGRKKYNFMQWLESDTRHIQIKRSTLQVANQQDNLPRIPAHLKSFWGLLVSFKEQIFKIFSSKQVKILSSCKEQKIRTFFPSWNILTSLCKIISGFFPWYTMLTSVQEEPHGNSVDNVKQSSDSAAYSVENKEFGDLCYNV